jgi:hypothetical protein
MPERYFEKFPKITYSNNEVVDITKRVTLLDRVSENPYVFYPYEITSGERADQFSFRYYDDQYRSWVLYLSNKIIDPYYEWYLENQQFTDFITKKYGSVPDSQQKIKYYRNNWETNKNETIKSSEYNSLTVAQQYYWEPIYQNSSVYGYKRKETNWNKETNKIVRYSVSANSYQLSSFVNNEIVEIVFDNMNSGNGQFVMTNTINVYVNTSLTTNTNLNFVFLRHMRGQYETNNTSGIVVTGNSYIYGTESQVNVAISIVENESTNDAVLVVSNNIPADEEIYWEGVTYFDVENEKNEYNKTIRVMEKNLSDIAVDNLINLMKEPF